MGKIIMKYTDEDVRKAVDELLSPENKKDSAPAKVTESEKNVLHLDYIGEAEETSSKYWYLLGRPKMKY